MAKKTASPKKRSVSTVAAKRKYGFKQRSEHTPKPPIDGFITFSKYVLGVLRANKGVFGRLLLLYVLLSLVVIGISQQTEYTSVSVAMQQFGEGVIGPFSQSLVLFGAAIGGSLNTSLSSSQQAYIGVTYLFMWLIVAWLLRYRLAGKAVKLRDGLYSAGAPIISSVVLILLAVVQLIPAAIGLVVYSAAISNGLLKGPLELIAFGFFAILLTAISFYWLTTTAFAFIIATVPGTYPMRAHKTARGIVIGQRLRLLTRLLWLGVQLLLTWVVVLLPLVLVTSWLNVSWLPFVVIVVQILTGWSLIYGASYVYLLYRKMIDEPATS